MGADNVANRSAALEPDFQANTINTTWYSNGTQLTGDNIPGTCTYDAALTPPTPAARPGYTFNGWTLRVPAEPVVTDCGISELSYSTYGSAYAAKKLNGGSDDTYGGATAATYGITQAGEFGITFSYGKITGIASCNSAVPESFTYWSEQQECYCDFDELGPENWSMCQDECMQTQQQNGDWTPSYDDGRVASNTFNSNSTGQYCWCRVTGYTPSGGNQCNASSLPWVFVSGYDSSSDCANDCAGNCAGMVFDSGDWRYFLYGHTDSE